MMIVCESATLADAIGRAARIAPTKGAAFDKAAGVVLCIGPAATHVTIQATDLETSFTQHVGCLEIKSQSHDAEPVIWRLPSQIASKLLAALPMGSGKTVTLLDSPKNPGLVKVTAGKTNAKLRTYDQPWGHIFPSIDRAELRECAHFATRIEQVAWCTSSGGDKTDVLDGVHIDGESMLACDRYTLVDVPCVVPVDAPITAPMGQLAPLLKNTGDVFLRATDHWLFLSTDPDTLMSTTLFAGQYPMVRKIQRDDHVGSLTVDRDEMVAALNRMLVLCAGDRYPMIEVLFDNERVFLSMDHDEAGHIDEEIEASGEGPWAPFEMSFTPTKLVSAVTRASEQRVLLGFGPSRNDSLKVLSKDYRVDMMPRAKGTAV